MKIKHKFKERYGNIDIFNPYIVIFFIIIFILVSLPMLYFSDELPRPSFQVYLYILLGIIFFIIGIKFPKILSKLSKKFDKKIKTLNKIKEKKLGYLPSFKISSYYKNNNKDNENKNNNGNKFKNFEFIILSIILIGLLLQIINFILLGGIPLFSGFLKAEAATKIWLFSYIFFIIGINILLANYNRKIYYLLLIIGLGLFALTGYRTTPIAILLSSFITLYYSRNLKIKYQILFGIIIIFLMTIIGFIAVQSIEWQHWRLNALELISYRAGFTINILDRTIPLAGSTQGELFYYTLTGFFKSVDPRVLVGQAVLGESHSITSTIFGPAILDFGWVGMSIQMFLIGFILKMLHIIQKHVKSTATAIYGIILGQTLIWIETGPTDIIVWFFYILGIITIIYYIYKIDYIYNLENYHNSYKCHENNLKK
ncbi:MAG: oligosaccharide repeat unit polymerase family protein [Methanobrevibacter arboriphilus]|uniref:Oligosaccharide repeat unit polymerase family protein n=1 Tax=Methanobrevibacter arboriphilus TaxID=39441 RepID=A0A843AEA3_METAZ|nr:oligosaccharide repeat unit polymerase family protein [Methanobrevibacter arboriphilus]MBF4469024.1 oligosaccharide repeat unit polymerase family protein [Methanobrevibacter arboriphilus]